MKRKIAKGYGKRILAAIMFAMTGSVTLLAQQYQWVDVTEIYLKNADLSAGNAGWTSGKITSPNVQTQRTLPLCEIYQTAGSVAQKVTGLMPGDYKLTVQGFNRPAENDGGAAYEAGTEVLSAKLFAGDDSVWMKSLYSETPDATLPNVTNGWPESWDGSNAFFTTYPDSYLNELTFSVAESSPDMLMGVVSLGNAGRSWTMFTGFKLYYDGNTFDVFALNKQSLNPLRDSLNTLGVAAAAQLTEVTDKYADYTETTPEKDLQAASTEMESLRKLVQEMIPNADLMKETIARAEKLLGELNDGTYTVVEDVKTGLSSAIAEAQGIMAIADLTEASEALPAGITALEETIAGVNGVIGLSYSLSASKNLADKVGGLAETPEYQQVLADMQAAELVYDNVAKHVTALNSVISAAITPEFLAQATTDNPIDFTAFIENPNIYQTGGDHIDGNNRPNVVDGWTVLSWGEYNSPSVTADVFGDTELYCSSWSDNDANNICKGHYQQMVSKESGVKLPVGIYELSAATYTSGREGTKIYLYASPDSVNYSKAIFNRDLEAYTDASKNMGTTTTVQNILVADGKLYIGINGEGRSGLMGAEWRADNFRLSYVGSDATGAYRDRLTARLEEGTAWHDSLVYYGIDDMDYLGKALDKEEGYYKYLAAGTPIQDLITAIEDMDSLILDAQKVRDQYLAFTPLVRKGNELFDALNSGKIFAQPTVRSAFINELVNASIMAEDITWSTYVSDEVGVQIESLNDAITALMKSFAVCYPLETAIILANQIGGLSENEAYKNVKDLLKQDEIDSAVANEALKELQAVCQEAMTPEVLAKATGNNPFDMTSFVANPNIYQDYVDEAGNPSRKVINGWVCETNADGTDRTEFTGDTWLWCYSWSGHEGHNIASATNYRQVVGTQIGEEGKFMLPVGTYRVEAATYATGGSDLLFLYAQTNDVEVSTVPGILEEDSTVYTYTQDQFESSTLNADPDLWDIAQSSVGTTTVVPTVYVDKGAVTIGIKGDGRVQGGHGQQWFADNFRLYYINDGKGDGMDDVLDNAEALESELVDVYDLTGTLVRRQVKRADAVKGLKKGIYIVGGQKYVVTGR